MTNTIDPVAANEAFCVGQRVQLHPATDLWMMGARYGEVVKVTAKYVHVLVDALGRVVKFHGSNVLPL